MPYTAIIKDANSNLPKRFNKRYEKNLKVYDSYKQRRFSHGYFSEKIFVDFEAIQSATKSLTEELVNKEKGSTICVEEQFIKKNTEHKLNIFVKKGENKYSNIVEIRNSDMETNELFDLARQLNRKAVREELDFLVIAGV